MARKETSEELSHLLDGRLSAESARLLRARIDEDPELYERYSALKSARDVVRADSGIRKLPQGFDARLRKRLHNEELKERAETRARLELAPRPSTKRLFAVLGGMAAGVALVFALGPVFGLNIFADDVSQDETQARTPYRDIDRPSVISVEYLEPIVAKKAAAVAELERQVGAMGDQVNPRWLEAEILLYELHADTRELEQMLEHAEGQHATLLLRQVKEIGEAMTTLRALARDSIRNQEALEYSRVQSLLQRAQSVPLDANSYQQARTLGQLRGNAGDQALEAYIRAREDYQAGRYENARIGFDSVRHQWPDSEISDLNLVFYIRSCVRTGRGPYALQMLEATTRHEPHLLKLLSDEDFSRLADTCGVEERRGTSAVRLGGSEGADFLGNHDFHNPHTLMYWQLKSRWQKASAGTR